MDQLKTKRRRSASCFLRGNFLSLAMLAVSAIAGSSASHAQSFTGLGVLPGTNQSNATGVSRDGSVVVGYSVSSSSEHRAFRWTSATGLVDLGVLPGNTSSVAWGVNSDGSVVVGDGSIPGTPGVRSFRWTAPTGPVEIAFGSITEYSTYARAVSGDGSVVVGGFGPKLSSNLQAFRWTSATGVVGLGFLPNQDQSVARAVSEDGAVIVGESYDQGGSQAFRWTAGTGMVGLGGNNSGATGVSADGSVIVGNSNFPQLGTRAVRWTASTGFVSLGILPGSTSSFADAVNADGSVVVGTSSGTAFRWTASTGMQSIEALLKARGVDVTGWRLQFATAVSGDGSVVVGNGIDPFGNPQAWIAHLAPLPAQSNIVAAVAPNARTAVVGTAVTAFATIINAGTTVATACSIELPNGVPALFSYQTTDPATNTPTGTPNIRTDIPPGKAQSFYFAITPTQTMAQDIQLVFACTNTPRAPIVAGLNTFLLSAGNNPITDMVSISDTFSHDGNIAIQGSTGTGVMVVASINLGQDGDVVFTPTDTPFGQPSRSLPLAAKICQTDSAGKCINPTTPGNSSTLSVSHGQTVFFTVFVQGLGTMVPYDPANNRIFVIAAQGGTPVGEASAAVKMQ